MPRKSDPRFDVDDSLEEQYADLMQRYRELENKSAKIFDAYMALKKSRVGGKDRPEIFLVIFAVLVLGRMALFVIVERMGTSAAIEALPANDVFGAVGAMMLISWLNQEWKANRWLAIPKAMLVGISLVVSASVFSNGAIWQGVATAPGGRPVPAMLLTLGTLILVASPCCRWIMDTLLDLVTDPVTTVKELLGGFRK